MCSTFGFSYSFSGEGDSCKFRLSFGNSSALYFWVVLGPVLFLLLLLLFSFLSGNLSVADIISIRLDFIAYIYSFCSFRYWLSSLRQCVKDSFCYYCLFSWLAIALKSYSFCLFSLSFFYFSYYCFCFFIYYSSLDLSLGYPLGSLALVLFSVFSSYSLWMVFLPLLFSSSSLAPLTFATNYLPFSLSCLNLMSAFSFNSLTLCYRFF